MNEVYTVRKISYNDTKPFLLNVHYARRMPNIMYAFGLFKNVYLFVNLATEKVDYLTLVDCQELGFDVNIDKNKKWFEV